MSFRFLHDELLEYQGQTAFVDVLIPWIEKNPAEIEWLRSIRLRTGRLIPNVSEDELWLLYAASRVFELLVLRFQSGRADGSDWPGPTISEDELVCFAERIGLDVMRPDRYSPFYHEIAALSCSPKTAQSPQIIKYHWPCLMLGPLLLIRAGVTVSASSSVMHPEVAGTSTLYWAHRRKTRPHHDLAHGWGHNSSWRTSFRRDYHLGDTFHFNVDGAVDLLGLRAESLNEEGLTPRERMELVANRCFVTVTKDNVDQFPYDDRFSLKAV
ncbi:hypothetical protein [Paraburkholderia megapolitana]|uniref:Uncharacterized protein n=1 Tax=Paraburkholderia megapolitana TaxID=420953 RepID=A0A1I3NZQ8_9BURK|nr:hypothetical protein [Paraburkholderia megapolitana]QDQ84549.1 hypothetical protein FNZ07_26070 [Paraburkholderia megapolitana]SFJ14679.1 hypothetical protein SAMN05192543_105575 [Paraburkholderia megapolitana]